MKVCIQEKWKTTLSKILFPLTLEANVSNANEYWHSRLNEITCIAKSITASLDMDVNELDVLSRSFDLFTTIGYYSEIEDNYKVKDTYPTDSIIKLMKFVGVTNGSKLDGELEGILIDYSYLSNNNEIDKELRILCSKLFVLKFFSKAKGNALTSEMMNLFNSLAQELLDRDGEIDGEIIDTLTNLDNDGFKYFMQSSSLPFNADEKPTFSKSCFAPIVDKVEKRRGGLFLLSHSNDSERQHHINELMLLLPKNTFGFVLSSYDEKYPSINETNICFEQVLTTNIAEITQKLLRQHPDWIVFDIDGNTLNQSGIELLKHVSMIGVQIILYVDSGFRKFSREDYLSRFKIEKHHHIDHIDISIQINH
jgi:hypothetical protein